MARVMHFVALLDSGCPVERHELTDEDWLDVGMYKLERDKHAKLQAQRAGNK